MKNLSLVCIAFILSIVINNSTAQNITITDDDGYSAESTAMLDVKSTSKGILIPRLDSSQRVGIVSPATGLLVFDTNATAFYYYDGSDWLNLTTNVISPASATVNDVLFSVINTNGDTVFAVYPEGVEINVGDGVGKAKKGGFAVGGLASGKLGQSEFLRVSADSVRIYIDTTTGTKAKKGGFAVGGLASGKALGPALFTVSDDSVRIYIDQGASKAKKGGFAVGGLASGKAETSEFLRVTADSVRIYIDTASAKANKGGFAVGGLASGKAESAEYMKISSNAVADIIDPSEPRFLWYPTKEAFLVGRVLVLHPDSVGMNSFVTGHESMASGDYSQAMGHKSYAIGDYSTAIGDSAITLGMSSTAIGNYATAIGNNSFAFGDSATAEGVGAFAIGSVGRDGSGNSTGNPVHASGDYSFALGMGTTASATNAFAMGFNTLASGGSSTAFGCDSEARGAGSIAGGYKSIADGDISVAIGYESMAGLYSVALGEFNIATGENAVAIGQDNFAQHDNAIAIGEANEVYLEAIAIGTNNESHNQYSYSFGGANRSWGKYSMSLGVFNNATNEGDIAIGYSATANGSYSFAIGTQNTASGNYSHATGFQNTASGLHSMSFGREIEAAGEYTIAFALNDQNGASITQDNTFAIMGGRIGIGVAAPSDTMEIAGNLNLNSGISSGDALSVNGAEAIWYDGTYFSWGAGGTKNYFEDNVGLGISSPDVRLHIKQTADKEGIRIVDDNGTDYWDIGLTLNNHLQFTSSLAYGRINKSGGAYSNGTGSKSLKNAEKMENILNKIIKLKPTYYHFSNENEKEPKSIGLIANEVELVFPELIDSDKNEENGVIKYITYDEFTVLSIQAIIELNEKLEQTNNSQSREIELLSQKIIELNNRLERLEDK